MENFRFTLGRTPASPASQSQGADSSSNVNLEWLLGLNKNLGDGSPDTQRFRDIISADSIQTKELERWLVQALEGDDELHSRAYQDISMCLASKMGITVEYGSYLPTSGQSIPFNGIWRTSNYALGVIIHTHRLENLDTAKLKSQVDEFLRNYDKGLESFACVVLLARGCSKKVEAQATAWPYPGGLRLLDGATFLELGHMRDYGLIKESEFERIFVPGRLLYAEDILAYVDSFLTGRDYIPQAVAQVDCAVGVVEDSLLSFDATPAVAVIETQIDSVAVETGGEKNKKKKAEPVELEDDEFVPEVVTEARAPQPSGKDEPEEMVETIDESQEQRDEAFDAATTVTVEIEEDDEASIEFVEEDDALAAIRGRVAALGGDEEIVVVEEMNEDGADTPQDPVAARLAALSDEPPEPPPPPPPTPNRKSPVPDVSSDSKSAMGFEDDSEPEPAPDGTAADITALEKVVANNPGNIPALVQLGKLFTKIAEFDRAIEYIKKVINEESDHVQANLVLGEIHYRKKEYPKAALSYDVVLNKDPNNLEALVNLGKVYLAQEKYSRALKILQRATKASPKPDADLELKLAKVFYLQEKLDKALVHLKSAQKIDPKNVQVHLALGHYHLDTKNPVEAKKAFEEGLRLDPGNIKLQTYVNNLQ